MPSPVPRAAVTSTLTRSSVPRAAFGTVSDSLTLPFAREHEVATGLTPADERQATLPVRRGAPVSLRVAASDTPNRRPATGAAGEAAGLPSRGPAAGGAASAAGPGEEPLPSQASS